MATETSDVVGCRNRQPRFLQRGIDIGIYGTFVAKRNVLFQNCNGLCISHSSCYFSVREGAKIANAEQANLFPLFSQPIYNFLDQACDAT